MPTHQLSLSLISHKMLDSIIEQRASDGYINATAMCQAAGKKIAKYSENDSTIEFLAELSADIRIRTSELMQSVKGGSPLLQGTWVHPQVAIHLAQWLSPKFAVQVSKWVYEWMSGKGQPTKLPFHLERHMLNLHKIPSTHFSVLQEMTNALVAPMEAHGYRLPDNMMPDITHGKMLCKYLRDKLNVDTDALPTYEHTFPDGRVVDAKLYPLIHLGEFRELLVEWLRAKAAAYFKSRDPVALLALDKMLLIGHTKPTPPKAANNSKFKKKA